MYKEGQILKITATQHNSYLKLVGTRSLTVVVVSVDEASITVELSEADAVATIGRIHPGRRTVTIITDAATPVYNAQWTIEAVADAPVVEIAPLPTPEPNEIMSRATWESIKGIYDVSIPENSYEEYLAAHQPTSTRPQGVKDFMPIESTQAKEMKMRAIYREQVVEAAKLLNSRYENVENFASVAEEKASLVAAGLVFAAHKSDDLDGTLKEIWRAFGGAGDWEDVATGLNSGLIAVEDLLVGFRQGMAIGTGGN